MKLAQQQAALAKWVLGTNASDTPEGLAPLKDLDATKGANLYRDAILEVEIKALIITFPIVHNLVADKYFRQAAKKYLRGSQQRSHAGNLDKIGEEFPPFLETVQAAEKTPYLADVARMELAIEKAGNGPDPAPLDDKTLKALTDDPSKLNCRLCPNANILKSEFPIDKIHAAWLDEFKDKVDLSTQTENTRFIVWRRQDTVDISRLSIDEWILLEATRDGGSYLKAVERALNLKPDIDIAAAMTKAIPNQWLEVTII